MASLTTPGGSDEYRLPTTVKPTHYDVTIKTDLENHTFEGSVQIDLNVKKPTSRIVLNTSDLDLGKASLYSDTLKAEQVLGEQTFDKTSERVAYNLGSTLPAGSKASLKVYFKGELTGSMMGYYKSTYEKDGKKKYYALTQFEPTAARRAFPCWDEPLLKATFAITLISRVDTTNLSNMPAVSEQVITPNYLASQGDSGNKALFSGLRDGEWKITKFETTPPMSSYIVAFANGHFEYLEDSVVLPLSGKTLPLRIYTTAEHIHQAQFALDVKKAVLPLYEKVFDVGYPLPKLDTLVASDFDAGAMENWGLITGRTNAFLLDPKKADLQAKKQIAATQSHEVAHMWFGNITTMEWWNYLYLNEGFATLVSAKRTTCHIANANLVFPEWKVDSKFISDHLDRALNLDAKPSSHAIEVDCPDANHINQIFDGLSYSKAASVLRMLSNYVGEDRFLKGVSIYLKNKLYGNSVTTDLWNGISQATGIDVPKVMDNWVQKIGFPVLTVTETSDGIHVRQDRFLETGKGQGTDNETIWNVPLRILTVDASGKAVIDSEALLSEREQFLKLDTSKPYKLNAGTTGVYRVLYEPKTVARIAEEAAKDNSVFSLNDRMGLVYDTVSLSKAGLADISSALTLIDILGKNEKEYLLWAGIGDNLSALVSTWWENQLVVDQLNALRRTLFAPLVKQLGYEYSTNDSADTTMLRTLAISQAAAARDPDVIKELQSRFEHYMKTGDDSRIPADLQRVTYSTVVRNGGRAEYDAIVAIHDKPKTPTARVAAIVAMGATHDPQLLQETFEFIKTKSRDQDIIYYFRGLSVNIKMRRALVEYFKNQYETLVKRFGGNFTMQSLVSSSFNFLSTEKDLKETEAFFKDKDNSKYYLALAQSLDSIRARIQFLQRSTTDLEVWLKNWQGGSKL
ncbi:Aminopeptidase 2, mitochondrial [Leucoagaricus sp. SymC.cos]|nr:Aminopeptidase 2, mitochondrial [Leucoagaricus sp. SymC.cos]